MVTLENKTVNFRVAKTNNLSSTEYHSHNFTRVFIELRLLPFCYQKILYYKINKPYSRSD